MIISRAKGTAYIQLVDGSFGRYVVGHLEPIDHTETPPPRRIRPRIRAVSGGEELVVERHDRHWLVDEPSPDSKTMPS